MLNLFKKSKKIDICAPFAGKVMDVKEINDPVFSQLMMGDGCGITPTEGTVVAPVTGTVAVVAETKHAVYIQTPEGLELMIHYGIDTVKYKGEGFDVKVTQGQTVRVGDVLMEVDMGFFREKGVELASPILVINGDAFWVESKELGKTVAAGELVMTVTAKK